MNRRTMLKNTAATIAIAPAAMLNSAAAAMAATEHPKTKLDRAMREVAEALDDYDGGSWHALIHSAQSMKGAWLGQRLAFGSSSMQHIQEVYDIYRDAHDQLFGPEVHEDYADLMCTPEQANWEISRLDFWRVPCRNHDDVAFKLDLICRTPDLMDDLKCGVTIGNIENGYSALGLFLSSLRGATTNIGNYASELRASFAERLPSEIEERRRRQEEFNTQASKREAKAKRIMHPEEKRLESEMLAALKALTDWQQANPGLAC